MCEGISSWELETAGEAAEHFSLQRAAVWAVRWKVKAEAGGVRKV